MLSIILVPMIFVQVITVFIFYERHWDTITRHMAANLASEIAFLIDGLGTAPDAKQIELVIAKGWLFFNFPVICFYLLPWGRFAIIVIINFENVRKLNENCHVTISG